MAHITESLEIIRSGANRILKFKAGNRSTGSLQFGSDATFSVDKPFSAADGTAAAPSLAFTNSTGVGFYRKASNVLGIATAGSERATINASGVLNLTSPGYITCATAGTVTTTATTAVTEYGDGTDHITVLTLTNFALGDVAGAAAKAVGAKLYAFPAGVHVCKVAYQSLALKVAGTAVAADLGLGSVIGSGVNATLQAVGATSEDYITGQTTTTAAGGGTAVAALLDVSAAINLNVTASVKDVFLNAAGTWNANNTGGLTATGTVVLKWYKIA